MNKTEISTKISRAVGNASLTLKKHSPEILLVGGIIGAVTSAVLACKATTKVSTILEKTKEDVDAIHNCLSNEEYKDEYTVEDSKKDLAIVYAQTGLEFIKLYGPSVALGTLSIVSILASHNILRKRNLALAAAYATMTNDFKGYRSRVVERFGEKVDQELKYGIKAKKIEEVVVDEETGKEKKVKKTVEVVSPEVYSPYARFFDEGSEHWEDNAEYNLLFLRSQQNYANDLLRARGHLFLNDVYSMLGIPKTQAGQLVGWIYDPERPNGDNYVDFGIYTTHREKARDFVNGIEKVILLDFNVDGDIWNLMNTAKYGDKFNY